jgi:hypothetical protein
MRRYRGCPYFPDIVRELMIAHAQPGLHQVYEQNSRLDEKRFEAWSAHLFARLVEWI